MLYFSSPSKKGFKGFFNRERFFSIPNLSVASFRNWLRSLKLFLFAENVYKALKCGNSVSDEKLFSSMIRVMRQVKGLNYIPEVSWLDDISRCCISVALAMSFSLSCFKVSTSWRNFPMLSFKDAFFLSKSRLSDCRIF